MSKNIIITLQVPAGNITIRITSGFLIQCYVYSSVMGHMKQTTNYHDKTGENWVGNDKSL
jgi:hypothetical protein